MYMHLLTCECFDACRCCLPVSLNGRRLGRYLRLQDLDDALTVLQLNMKINIIIMLLTLSHCKKSYKKFNPKPTCTCIYGVDWCEEPG